MDIKHFMENQLKISCEDFAEKCGLSVEEVENWQKNPEEHTEEFAFCVSAMFSDVYSYTYEYIKNYEPMYASKLDFDFSYPKATVRKKIKNAFEKWELQKTDSHKHLSNKLATLKKDVLSRLVKPKLAIVGASDAGKTSLINNFLGEKFLPQAWTPETAILVYIKHIEDKPEFIKDNVWIFKKGADGEDWDESKLYNESYCKNLKLASGSIELLARYGTHNGTAFNEDIVSAAVVFADKQFLKNCDIIDVPGLVGGFESDNIVAGKVPLLADIIIYMSQANYFLGEADFRYIDNIFNSLNTVKNTKAVLNSMFFVASQADTLNGNFEENIQQKLDNGCDRLCPYLEHKYAINKEELRKRFFAYTTMLRLTARTEFENAVKKYFQNYYKFNKQNLEPFIKASFVTKDTVADLYEFIKKFYPNENITPKDPYALTPEQKEIVEYNTGDLVVKGVAGSGKSLVLMQRAIWLRKKYPNSTILLTSYQNSIINDLKERIKDPQITISTLDKYAWGIYSGIGGDKNLRIVDSKERKEYANKAVLKHKLTNPAHRLHKENISFWEDEFTWIKGKNLTSESDYCQASRNGRGSKIRLGYGDKKVVYTIYQYFCDLLKENNYHCGEDVFSYIDKHHDLIPNSKKFDYVLIDEAQDLPLIKLKVAKHIAKENITVAADKAQNLYNTSFTWKNLGISIRGRASKELTIPYRNTLQIAQLSKSLLEVNRAILDTSDYTEYELPNAIGAIPVVVKCNSNEDEWNFINNLFGNDSGTTGVFFRTNAEKQGCANWLNARGFDFEDGKCTLNKPGIKLYTFHSSKGLEFDRVIIPRFNQGVLPDQTKLRGVDETQRDEIIAQERSVLYVGMTRAKRELFFTFYGEPSPFLYDFAHEFYRYIAPNGEVLDKPQRTNLKVLRKITGDEFDI